MVPIDGSLVISRSSIHTFRLTGLVLAMIAGGRVLLNGQLQ